MKVALRKIEYIDEQQQQQQQQQKIENDRYTSMGVQ